MLFDLKGRRRHVVQVTYLFLAILMGGGLVFFGIGGSVSGGLLDAFKGSSTSSNSIVQKQIDENEAKLETDPNNAAALKDLARNWYSLANDEADPTTGAFTDEGKERLANADDAWQRYLDLDPKKPDASLASLMVQAYAPTALNKAAEGAEAAEIVTTEQPSAQGYLQLATYAAAAGQDRKADLAGQKAVELAPKKQRSTVKQLVKQATQAPPPASTTTTPSG